MRFGIVSDEYKDTGFQMRKRVSDILEAFGAEVTFPAVRNKSSHEYESQTKNGWDGVDMAISIGGDGTFLFTCHMVYPLHIPLIGINLGTMGFMTEIEKEDLEMALLKLTNKDYKLKSRLMLEATIYDDKDSILLHDFALNDAVLYRASIMNIIPVSFHLNGIDIESIPSDGIIVASPTGSTGYALACGGPIVDPGIDVLLVTPISPHTLHNRTYVIDPNQVVQISIPEDYSSNPLFSLDGKGMMNIQSNMRIEIKRAERPMQLVSVEDINFFKRLPDKINARGRV